MNVDTSTNGIEGKTSSAHSAVACDEIWRIGKVASVMKYSRSGIYRAIRADGFPLPIRLGARSVGWFAREVLAFIGSRPRVNYAKISGRGRHVEK